MTELQDYEIVMCEPHELSEPLLSKLERDFKLTILPTLTPLGIDAYHPFPKLNNKV